MRRLLLRCEPSPENDIQNLALYNCIQAVDHLTRQLSDGSQYLSACTLAPLAVHSSQDSHAGGAAPVVMWPPVSSQDGVKRDVGGVGAGEHVSSQEEAALLLGASQVRQSRREGPHRRSARVGVRARTRGAARVGVRALTRV